MFRRRPAPLTLAQKTEIYKKRLQESQRIQTPGGRYQALALLIDDIQKDLIQREKTFSETEDRRMLNTILGLGAGIPLAAGAAALAGAPLALLVLIPAVMSSGIYASHKNREAQATFNAENKSCLPVIHGITQSAIAAQEQILAHHADAFAASPQHAGLVQTCPRLKAHFANAQEGRKHPAPPATPQNAPRPPSPPR